MSKVEKKKQQKRDMLLESSFLLFTEKGFQKTSISDIVAKAGVAKGTFYLYFNDKYDVRNKLISYKSSHLFEKAYHALNEEAATDLAGFTNQVLYVVNHIINQLTVEKELLTFISKNLSWGVFKNALTDTSMDTDTNFPEFFHTMIEESPLEFENPEIMMFMIIEMVGSTIYSSILYSDPAPIDTLKPYLYKSIQDIIKHQSTQK